MIEIMLTGGLLVIQIGIYWLVKRRWPLLILPAIVFILFVIPDMFRTYEGVPAAENLKMNVARMLLDSVYVLVLLAPLAFAYIKKTGWRILIATFLVLTVPTHISSCDSYSFGSIVYTVYFQYYNLTEPSVHFEFNFPRDRYGNRYVPPKPPDTTRSLPSTTTQPTHT